jgi:AraC family transcriptional regulator
MLVSKDEAGGRHMDWTQRLTEALDYLEDSLEREVDVERAARLANCSHFHFCRMFEVVIGTTPGEYVRRRRLSRAAMDLAVSGDKVIDIALRYGYDSPEAFAKAFKRCFGLTPSEARQPGAALETWPPIRLAVILKGDKSMKYRIVEKPAFRVSGLVLRTTSNDNQNNRAIPAFWQDINGNGKGEAVFRHCGAMGVLGVCYDYQPADNSFAYMAGIETPAAGAAVLPAGCESTTLPAATYAVFESIGPMPHAIQAVWKAAYSDWFPSSGYEHAGTPDFEVYPPFPLGDPRGDPASPQCVSEVWIPIKKKA